MPRLPISPLHAYSLADVAGSLRKALRDIYMGDCLSLCSVAAPIKWVQVMNKERSLSGSWFWRFLGGRPLTWGREKRKNPRVPGPGHLLL